jgi:hypothetical protein
MGISGSRAGFGFGSLAQHTRSRIARTSGLTTPPRPIRPTKIISETLTTMANVLQLAPKSFDIQPCPLRQCIPLFGRGHIPVPQRTIDFSNLFAQAKIFEQMQQRGYLTVNCVQVHFSAPLVLVGDNTPDVKVDELHSEPLSQRLEAHRLSGTAKR